MTHFSFLALTTAALIGMAGTPALAQSEHQATGRTTTVKAPVQQAAKSQPAKATTKKAASSGAQHQTACRNRYKSYDAKSDSYLYQGKKVRCTL